jgi:SAM-dependent methyltransferase
MDLMLKKTAKKIVSRFFAESRREWRIFKLYWQLKVYFAPANPNTEYYWDAKLSKFDTFWRNENYRHILNLFPENREFSLLDIGCALGDGCELIQGQFPKAKITGVDISKTGIQKCRQKNQDISYFVLDVLKNDLPGTYDFISVIETLEHFDNPFFILNKCLPYAKKSVIVSVPYSPGYTGRIVRGEHRYAFNEKTFAASKYKFRIVKITGYVQTTNDKCIVFEFFPPL